MIEVEALTKRRDQLRRLDVPFRRVPDDIVGRQVYGRSYVSLLHAADTCGSNSRPALARRPPAVRVPTPEGESR
jgi:hypothetical protein